MQDYALLNTCCIFKYERFCNLQCLLHLNFWIYFLKNMVLHMKMCKSLHIAHFEYATLQYIVPHFGSLFCTLWIFKCAKSCTLQCNISKVPILTLYVKLKFELWSWSLRLKLKFEVKVWSWSWSLKLKFEVKVEVEVCCWSLGLKFVVEVWRLKF